MINLFFINKEEILQQDKGKPAKVAVTETAAMP